MKTSKCKKKIWKIFIIEQLLYVFSKNIFNFYINSFNFQEFEQIYLLPGKFKENLFKNKIDEF